MSNLNDGSDALLTDGSADFGLETALEDLLEEFGATNSSTDLRMANAASTVPLPTLDGGLPLVALQRGLAALQGEGGPVRLARVAAAPWANPTCRP